MFDDIPQWFDQVYDGNVFKGMDVEHSERKTARLLVKTKRSDALMMAVLEHG